jgi:glycerophosphoryl diester phosphodiesterase
MLIIGHRGYPLRYPENTIASLLGAIVYGADGVEFDVRLTGDGRLVIIHDGSLKRVAGVDILVRRAAYHELARYSLGMGQHIPLLEDALKALPRGKLLMVEVKDPDASLPVYSMLKGMGRLGESIILSFHTSVLREVRRLDPHARIGVNVESLEAAREALRLASELRLEVVNIPAEAINVLGADRVAEYLRAVRRLGVKAGMWGVNSWEVVNAIGCQLDIAITDNVEELIASSRGRAASC